MYLRVCVTALFALCSANVFLSQPPTYTCAPFMSFEGGCPSLKGDSPFLACCLSCELTPMLSLGTDLRPRGMNLELLHHFSVFYPR